jgi:phage terminase large subunit-like protein
MGQLNLYEPHAKQQEIHTAIAKEEIFYVIAPIGRQFGKTLCAINQGLMWAVENSNWNIVWVSPTYKQCKKVFRQMIKGLDDCAFVVNINRSDLIIEFDTGSQIIFYSAEAYDTIRGESITALIGDEFGFWHRLAWGEAVKPALLVAGKKALLISTPNGRDDFYNMSKYSADQVRYTTIHGTSYDNPHANIEEIDDAKHNLPDHIFKQEYLAEFIDDGSSVFRNITECISKGKDTSSCYFGLDLGRADDYTVLTIVNDQNEEIYCDRWRHMEWSAIISNVATALNKYKAVGYVEANATQDAIYEQIRNKITYNKNMVQPFITTTKSKPIIIEDLIVAFEQKELRILGEDFQVEELNVFTYEYSLKTRNIKYSAPIGLHDDYVMSRALTHHAFKNMKSAGKYTIR